MRTTFIRRIPSACAVMSCMLFALTPGPALAQSQNQIVGFGFGMTFWYPGADTPAPSGVTPGEVVTLFTAPLGVPNAVATQVPLPTSLAGVSISVRVVGADDTTGYPTSLPILRIRNITTTDTPAGVPCSATGPTPVVCSYSQVTVQIPVEPVCVLTSFHRTNKLGCGGITQIGAQMLLLNVKANGITGPDFLVKGNGAPHLLNSCDTIFGPPGDTPCHSLVTHADGTLVSEDNPAKVGETISIYAVGGATFYPVSGWPATGYAPAAPIAYPYPNWPGGFVTFSYLVSRNLSLPWMTGTTVTSQTIVQSSWSGLVAGYVGLYQINVAVPPMPNTSYQCDATFPSGSGNVQIVLDDPVNICVRP